MLYPTFQKKVPLSAADLNLAMDALKRARVLPGVGIKLTETLNGTVVSLKPLRTSGGGVIPDELHPWKIINMSGTGTPDADGKYPNYEFSVYLGKINGIMPPNLFDVDKLALFTVSGYSVGNVILKAKSNGKEIISATVEISSSVPTPKPAEKFAVPTDLDILLAVVYNGSVFQIEDTHFVAEPSFVGIVTKSSPAAGEYPYEVFFNWKYHNGSSGGGSSGGEELF